MSIRTNIFSLTKLFEDGHVMEISLEFERRAKAYNELLAENERLRSASFVTAIPSEHYERVIKAGDEMMEVLESEIPFTAINAVNGWLAAKEGGAK